MTSKSEIKMIVYIFENKPKGRNWSYRVSDNELARNIRYDYADYDQNLKFIIATEVAVKKIFGSDIDFVRDTTIRNYIVGDLFKDEYMYIDNDVIDIA